MSYHPLHEVESCLKVDGCEESKQQVMANDEGFHFNDYMSYFKGQKINSAFVLRMNFGFLPHPKILIHHLLCPVYTNQKKENKIEYIIELFYN